MAVPANQALPPKGEARRVFNRLTVASWVQLTWLSIGLVQMIKLSLWDSFCWLHDDSYQRRSPFRLKSGTDCVPLYNNGSDLAPIR